jgi:phosphoribosylformimino-5-aminoimidazole carboxamide ribotide isomerase
MQIIPAIDIRAGRCVRLRQGDFTSETVYNDNPLEVARNYQQLGFSYLHIVDLDGARSGTQSNATSVREIAAGTDLCMQLGGGLRDEATIRHWLENGVERCVTGSVAVEDPNTARSWIETFGASRIVLALDVRLADDDIPWLSTRGWTRTANVTLWQSLDEFMKAGVAHILCTDISRDGALSGPNLGLYREIVKRYPGILLQASGGVRHIADLVALRDTGAKAAVTGRALLDGCIGKQEIAPFLHVA